MADPGDISPTSHSCNLCGKNYQRTDLLARHRRRCSPGRSISKRRACRACMRAKSKCSCETPSCSRCLSRGTSCVYEPSSGMTASGPNAVDSTTDIISSHIRSLSERENLTEPDIWNTSSLYSGDDWMQSLTTHIPPWMPDDLGASSAGIGLESRNGLDAADITAFTMTADPITLVPDPWVMQIDSRLQHAVADANFTGTNHSTRQVESGANTHLSERTISVPNHSRLVEPVSPLIPDGRSIIALLRRYIEKLARSDYQTPLLHRELYLRASPDIVTLSKSSAAICCVVALAVPGARGFARRTAAAEQLRIARSFHESSCISQWDALHAAWIYELLAILDRGDDHADQWKLGETMGGLHSNLLVKMTRKFQQSHAGIREGNPASSELRRLPSEHAGSASDWATWTVAESARRTIFFANLINWTSSHLFARDGDMEYYEAIDDDLVLNMPLPSSTESWLAETSAEWRQSLLVSHTAHQPRSLSNILQNPGSPISLRTLMAEYTKNGIRDAIKHNLSFENSASFRNLIIWCALEQFG